MGPGNDCGTDNQRLCFHQIYKLCFCVAGPACLCLVLARLSLIMTICGHYVYVQFICLRHDGSFDQFLTITARECVT